MQAARAERDALDDKPLRHQPALPLKYHYRALELAYALEGDTGRIILNPRDINTNDLEMADRDWLEDMNRFRAARRWGKQSINVVAGGRGND